MHLGTILLSKMFFIHKTLLEGLNYEVALFPITIAFQFWPVFFQCIITKFQVFSNSVLQTILFVIL